MAGVSGLVVVVLVTVAAVTWWVSRPSDDEPSTDGFATDRTAPTAALAGPPTCGEAPLVEAESMDMTADGLTISAAFMSACASESVESHSAVEVTVASGRRDIAAGTFDFSSDPMALEAGVPTRRTLVFPAGMYWRTPDMVSGAPDVQATRNGNADQEAGTGDRERSTMTAVASAEPANGSIDGVARAVLEELRNADLANIARQLSNSWVPQVSSKRVGLVVDGETLTNADILGDHLAFRQRFDGARLLWSGHWTTFNAPDFWITVVMPSYYFSDFANRWCEENDFGIDDCFAKYVSNVVGVDGTTVYRR